MDADGVLVLRDGAGDRTTASSTPSAGQVPVPRPSGPTTAGPNVFPARGRADPQPSTSIDIAGQGL
jgi:hypothetical protein